MALGGVEGGANYRSNLGAGSFLKPPWCGPTSPQNSFFLKGRAQEGSQEKGDVVRGNGCGGAEEGPKKREKPAV